MRDEQCYESKDVAISISQLLIYNAVKYKPKDKIKYSRHVAARETPLPIYVALKVHGKSQSAELVDQLHKLGLSLSYKRMKQISRDTGNTVIAAFEADNAPCMTNLLGNLLTIGGIDNIDENPSHRDAHESLHGTAISLTQFPNINHTHVLRSLDNFRESSLGKSKLSKLPQFYSNVNDYNVRLCNLKPPCMNRPPFLIKLPNEKGYTRPPQIHVRTHPSDEQSLTAQQTSILALVCLMKVIIVYVTQAFYVHLLLMPHTPVNSRLKMKRYFHPIHSHLQDPITIY